MKTSEKNIVVENGILYINDIEIIRFNQEIDDPFDDPNNDGIAMV